MFHTQNQTIMSKIYTQAPLPFMGQKRRWSKDYKAVIINEFADYHTFVDLFGGSGLLSQFTKSVRPDAKVIYNDYDDYQKRLRHIDTTNRLLKELRLILGNSHDNQRIIDPQRTQILDLFRKYENRGEFVDYISLSNSILFSGKYAASFSEIASHTFYNRIRTVDFNADGYLTDINIVHCDYRQLVEQYKYQSGVCFIADPPYLSTQVSTYQCCWDLRDYLDVISSLKGASYIYFTSTKSNIIELCEWLERECSAELNPLHGAKRLNKYENINYSASYMEVMLYKHKELNERRDAA